MSKKVTQTSNVLRLSGYNARRGLATAIVMLEKSQQARAAALAATERDQAASLIAEADTLVGLAIELMKAALEGKDLSLEARTKLFRFLQGDKSGESGQQ